MWDLGQIEERNSTEDSKKQVGKKEKRIKGKISFPKERGRRLKLDLYI